MAVGSLLKKAADWSNLATGVRVNDDGTGFVLVDNFPFFNFEQDDGVLFIEADAGEAFGNATGTLRSNNNRVDYVGFIDVLKTGSYKDGFSESGDFEMRFKFNLPGATSVIAFGITNTSYAAVGRDILVGGKPSEGVYIHFSNATYILNSIKGGVRSFLASNPFTAGTDLFMKVQRLGTDAIATLYSDEFVTSVNSFTIPNTTSAILTSAWMGVSRNTTAAPLTPITGWMDDMELRCGPTKYLTTSPFISQGPVSLTPSMIINGLGDLIEKLDGAAGISPAFNINGVGFTALGMFATYKEMDDFLNANPIIIAAAPNNTVDVGHTHDSGGDDQAEVFVSEGPNLTCSISGSQAAIEDVRLGTIYNDGTLTGTAAIPAKPDTRKDTPVDDGVGTLAVVPANDTRFGVPTDDTVGNYIPADPSKYDIDEQYGSLGTEFTGTRQQSFIGEIEIVEVFNNVEVVEVR